MRYTIPKELYAERAEIEFNNRIYEVDDSEANYEKIKKIIKDKSATSYDIIAQALGKEAADEIQAQNPSYRAVEMLGCLIFAAIEGLDPQEAVDGYFRTKTKKK